MNSEVVELFHDPLLSCYPFKLAFVHNIAGARRSLDDLLSMPLAKCAADTFTRHTRHGGEVVLGDLVPDQASSRYRLLTEVTGELEQGAGHARAHRQKTRRHHVLVGLAQASGQRRHDIDVELGILVQRFGEGGAPDKGEFAVPDRLDSGRPWQAIDHRQLAHDRTRPQEGENALLARGRSDADREHAMSQPIAAVAGVASLEQRLAFAQLECPLAGPQLA
jgi:hypothetical protein